MTLNVIPPSFFRLTIPKTIAATSALALALAGCSAAKPDAAGNDDAVVSVTTAFYPLAWVTEQVGGDRVAVTDLTPVGSDGHNLELSPAAVDALGQDDLVVYLKGFQPAMDNAVATIQSDKVTIFEAGPSVDLQPAGHAHAHDHAAHEADAHDHAHDHAGGMAGMDPHFWLDPLRLADVATEIGDKLAEIDPEGAEIYRANAEATVTQLTELSESFDEGLAQCSHSSIIVTHEAYGYLTEPRRITQIGISGIDPESEPSPARIAEIEEAAKNSDATTVFGEVAVNPKVAQVIAEQTGLQYGLLDPLGSRVTEDATYPEQMQANLDALRLALECA